MTLLLIYQSLHTFFVFLELLLFLYFISAWLPLGISIKTNLYQLVNPLLLPVRFMLRKSIFQAQIDLAPIITFLMILFLQRFFYNLI